MGAVAGVIEAITKAIGAITSVIGILKAPELPKMKFPEIRIPEFKIPEEELEMLRKQIESNITISEEARKAAIEALQNYNLGKLSPTYEALYNEYARERTRRVMEELAARGFREGSTEYNIAMAELTTDLAAVRAQLLRQQLDDALRIAGLSETTINELYSKWKTQAALTESATGIAAKGVESEFWRRMYELHRWGTVGEAMGKLGESLEDILKPKPTETPAPPETPPPETPPETTAGRLTRTYETYFSLADLIPEVSPRKIRKEIEEET